MQTDKLTDKKASQALLLERIVQTDKETDKDSLV
jgi:hypothetical protein